MNDTQYEDLRDIYDMVAGKNQFSISEIEAITTELGRSAANGRSQAPTRSGRSTTGVSTHLAG